METDDIPRISATEADKAVRQGALLVSSYETEEWYRDGNLEGSVSIHEFRKLRPKLPKDKEIIFFCECPAEESAVREAKKNRTLGFTNVKALLGGIKGWKDAGLKLAVPERG